MKIRNKGFTLVELLIVIALIAILSVAVLATINPIEQSNKARDAKFKNDAAEVLSAYERYYTSLTSYPWMSLSIGEGSTLSYSVNTAVVVGSTSPAFGVASIGDTDGPLIATSELKSSFSGKESFQDTTAEEDKMYTYHNGATNDNYVCYHPKAAANRSDTSKLKCLDASGKHLYDYGGTCTDVDWETSSLLPSATEASFVCVPEGSVGSAT